MNELGSSREQDALRLLRQARPAEEGPEVVAARRARLLPALVAHVQQAPRKRRRARVLWGSAGGALAAAACAVLWFAVPGMDAANQGASGSKDMTASARTPMVHATQGALQVLRGPEEESVPSGQQATLQLMDQLRTTADGAATVTLPTGSTVELQRASRVQVAQLNAGGYESLRLEQGSVHVRVPKLATGEYFAILTESTKVVVHGTEFTVDVGERAVPGSTCVEVQEGLVAVHAADAVHWVNGGSAWGCRAPEPEVPEQAAAVNGAPAEAASTRVAGVAPSARAADKAVSLAEQNRLFQRALTLQRAKEWAGATQAYEELLRRFPDSPIAQEARVQLKEVRRVSAPAP